MAKLIRNLRKHYQGCYRADSRTPGEFIQIRRCTLEKDGTGQPSADGRWWMVEHRVSATGELRRYGGVFKTCQDAFNDTGAPRFKSAEEAA